MLHDIISAKLLEGYKLELTFDDGKAGVVDFSVFIPRGGVFEKWNDYPYFTKFVVDPEVGNVTWDHEIDVAPETLYSMATQSPLPGWMKPVASVRETA